MQLGPILPSTQKALEEPVIDSPRSSSLTEQRVAALLMNLAPGAAMGCYVAAGGFYIKMFNNPGFLNLMTLAVWAPQPAVVLLQHNFDHIADAYFSTRLSFFFRVVAMQLVLASIVVAWMFVPPFQGLILMIGVALGAVGGAIVSSSLQLSAAIDPTNITITKIGTQAGGAALVLAFVCLDFKPSATTGEFQVVLACVAIVTALMASFLTYLHYFSDTFEKGYRRLSYDSSCAAGEEGETDFLLPDVGPRRRQVTETTPSGDPRGADDGIPMWVWYWIGLNGIMNALSMFLASLAGFFGDALLAQTLQLVKLTTDFAGRSTAAAIPYVPGFHAGPWHKVITLNFLLMVGFWGVTVARLFKAHEINHVLLLSWICVFGLTIVTGSLVDVSSGCYVEVKDRKAVARTSQLVVVSGICAGIVLSIVLATGRNLPTF